MSAERLPLCIPVSWNTQSHLCMAYHHGWTDQAFYNVVQIRRGGNGDSDDYIATVDDFGNLVPVGTVNDLGFVRALWPLWFPYSRNEYH